MPASPKVGFRRFHGRRKGKRLRPRQQEYLDLDLPRLAITGVSVEQNPERNELDLPKLFGRVRPVKLEIGFGKGEHLLHVAAAEPEAGFIGCEPFINGVASFLGKLRLNPLSNVRIHPGDVRDLFDVLPAKSLGGVYLLYPDPWPKRRHHGRRFVNDEFLGPLSAAMKPGAELRIATDIGDYARQAIEKLSATEEFCWTAENASDWRVPWRGWISTRYEKKAHDAGRKPIYLIFRRR